MKKLLAAVLCLTLCVGFTACGDDDDKENASQLLGNWKTVEYTRVVKKGTEVLDDTHIINPTSQQSDKEDFPWEIVFEPTGGAWIWGYPNINEWFDGYSFSNGILTILWDEEESDDVSKYRVTFNGGNEITIDLSSRWDDEDLKYLFKGATSIKESVRLVRDDED